MSSSTKKNYPENNIQNSHKSPNKASTPNFGQNLKILLHPELRNERQGTPSRNIETGTLEVETDQILSGTSGRRYTQSETLQRVQQDQFRPGTPSRNQGNEILSRPQINQFQPSIQYRTADRERSQEEFSNLSLATIQEDSRYVSRQAATFLSVTRQLYRATKIMFWTIIVLFFVSLLGGFLFPSSAHINPSISFGGSSSGFPRSEPVFNPGFLLSTQYPFILLMAFVFTMALYYAINYVDDFLVKIARISATIQNDQSLRQRH